MRKAKLPLNPAAVEAADDALNLNHPELGGRKLSMAPKDGALRKEWMDSYLANDVPSEGPDDLEDLEDPDAPAAPPAEPVAPCPCPPPPPAIYANESTTTGNEIDIAFDPDKSKKIKTCERIVHVQFLRMYRDGVVIKPTDLEPSWDYRDKIMTPEGWCIDSLATETSPDYQQGVGDGHKTDDSGKARMSDDPYIPATAGGGAFDPVKHPTGWRTIRLEFQTFAYCMQGPDCGNWYEGVQWEYIQTSGEANAKEKGQATITNGNLTDAPGKEQLDAFAAFNKEKGFAPCK